MWSPEESGAICARAGVLQRDIGTRRTGTRTRRGVGPGSSLAEDAFWGRDPDRPCPARASRGLGRPPRVPALCLLPSPLFQRYSPCSTTVQYLTRVSLWPSGGMSVVRVRDQSSSHRRRCSVVTFLHPCSIPYRSILRLPRQFPRPRGAHRRP